MSSGGKPGRPILRFGNGKTHVPGNLKPALHRDLYLGQGFLRRIAVGRTRLQVGHVGNPACVVLIPE